MVKSMVKQADAQQNLGSSLSAIAQPARSLLKTYHVKVSKIASQAQGFMKAGK
jgi:hypothetical protein